MHEPERKSQGEFQKYLYRMKKKKTYQNLWESARAVFGRESVTLNASIRIAF